ncbi:hypothetical protein Tco_1087824 [Tanacetum coccineum]
MNLAITIVEKTTQEVELGDEDGVIEDEDGGLRGWVSIQRLHLARLDMESESFKEVNLLGLCVLERDEGAGVEKDRLVLVGSRRAQTG